MGFPSDPEALTAPPRFEPMPANSRCRPRTYTGPELEALRSEGKTVGSIHIL